MDERGARGSWLNRVFGLADIRRLTFSDPNLECGYRAYEVALKRRTFRRAVVLGALAIGAFILPDILFSTPEIATRLSFLRIVVSGFVFMLGFALTFLPVFERCSRLVTAGTVVLITLTVLASIMVAPAPISHMYYVGVVMTIFFSAFLFSSCWAAFAYSSGFVLVSYIISALFWLDMPPSVQLVSIMFTGAASLVGLAASFSREDNLRKAYALGESLRVERDRVAAANLDLEHRVSDRVAETVALNSNLQQELEGRQQVERELATERDLLSSVLTAMNDVVVVYDPVARKPLRWNPAILKLTGYTYEEVKGRRIPEDWLSPEDQARVHQAVQTVYQSGRAAATVSLTHKNGHKIPVEFVGSLLSPTNGGPSLLVALGRNLTERQHAQQALRASRERLELALRSANMGIWEYDWRTQQLLMDRISVELLGVSSGPLFSVIQELGTHIQPSLRASLKEMFRNHLAQVTSRFDIDFAYDQGDDQLWITMSGGVVERDSRGQPLRTVGLLRDITSRRQLDERMRETAKLEAIGRLAGGVAHDFNNLLTVINGYGELAMIGLDADTEIHEMLQVILEQGQRAAALTRQLLTFSRREPVHLQPLDINTLIQDLGRMLRRLIGEDVELLLGLAPDIPLINADQTQLEQVLMNLAVNARDAMPYGGTLTISVEVEQVTDPPKLRLGDLSPGRYAVLKVSDTGHGMDAETLRHLFEPFYTTKPQGQGTGLGLAVVYGVMKGLNGGIAVESAVDQGTTFLLYLPVSVGDVESEEPVEPPVLHGTETILLVEDEAAVRSLVRRMLQQWGYKVLEASDGIEALALVEPARVEIDLLLTDVVMPRMTGPVLSEKLMERWPNLKVLFITGYNSMLTQDRLKPNSRLLNKPLKQSALSQALRELLSPDEPR